MRVEETEAYRDWINRLKDLGTRAAFRCESTGSFTETPGRTAISPAASAS